MEFEPTIVGFLCNWCSYTGADLAGTARIKHRPNLRVIRVMCSGRVDPTFVLQAFASGADGVMICGCHPGDCHYLEGNDKAYRRHQLLKTADGRLRHRGEAAAPGVGQRQRGRTLRPAGGHHDRGAAGNSARWNCRRIWPGRREPCPEPAVQPEVTHG